MIYKPALIRKDTVHALSKSISNTCVIAASEPQSQKNIYVFVRLRLGGRNDRQLREIAAQRPQ